MQYISVCVEVVYMYVNTEEGYSKIARSSCEFQVPKNNFAIKISDQQILIV